VHVDVLLKIQCFVSPIVRNSSSDGEEARLGKKFLCEIWNFYCDDFEDCKLLGRDAV